MIYWIFLSLVLVFPMAYGETVPEPMTQNPPIEIPLGKVPYTKNKKAVQKGPVILDARPFFKFSMNHIENSQPIRFEDYSQTEDPFKGLLDPDPQVIARKLAALGVSPQSEVIILGEGLKGNGEEGRIAWMLKYVGVNNVKVQSYDSYIAKSPARRNSQSWNQKSSAVVWLAKPNPALRIRRQELEKDLQKFSIIDCGSKEEFEKGHLPEAIRISWQDFLSADGGAKSQAEIKKLLETSKVDLKKELVLYGHGPVGCGYGVFILNEAGLTGAGFARHYDGAYEDWKSNQKN